MTAISPLARKGEGALLAAAAGDALGWPQEPRGGLVGGDAARRARPREPAYTWWERHAGTRFQPYRERVRPGDYSDDTQLTLAVARACLHGDGWAHHLSRIELPAWLTYQRGAGAAVLRAARSWSRGHAPWDDTVPASRNHTDQYLAAGANGVAMRIAPHVIYAITNNLVLPDRIVTDGLITHGHPRAIVGALCFAAALEAALTTRAPLEPADLIDAARDGIRGSNQVSFLFPDGWFATHHPEDYFALWARTTDEMHDLLATAAASIRRGTLSDIAHTLDLFGATGRHGGAGTISTAAAVFLAARAGTNPLSGLIHAAFHPRIDTDTIAAMTGALLGATHGTDWLGPLTNVQDGDYISELAAALATPHTPTLALHARPPSVADLHAQLDNQDSRSGHFPDGRPYVLNSATQISDNPPVQRYQLTLDDRQTVIIDRPRSLPRTTRTDEHRQRTSIERAPVTPTARPVTKVTLATADIHATQVFYSTLLGVDLPLTGTNIQINDSLEFAHVPGDYSPGAANAQIIVEVESLPDAAARTNLTLTAAGYLTTTDPDGRRLFVYPRVR